MAIIMAKIAKLTWLHNGNYGTVLQAFALQRFLRNNGYDVTDLDYNASLKTKLKNLFVNRNSLKLFLGKFKEAKGKKNYPHPELYSQRARKFDSFLKDNMNLSRQFSSPEEIAQISEDYDVYICGSDQIWSPYLLNPVFYFGFLPDDKKRISYATSFGVTSTTSSKEKKIRSFLDKFDSISLRETQGQDFVEKLTGKRHPVCLDPTLLLGKQEWDNYCADRLYEEKYIFAYLLTPNPTYEQAIREFAEKKGLKVVIVPTAQGPFNTGFTERVESGPAEWLSLIKNAEYVFTDSFHGFIFSLVFEKEVFLFKRFDDSKKVSQNSRIYTLTALLGLQSRIIDRDSINRIYEESGLDYDRITSIIHKEADVSGRWLTDALKKVCE